MKPISVNSAIGLWLEMGPEISAAFKDGNMSVGDAIDLAAETAKTIARRKGVLDNVIVTTKPKD